MRHDQRHRVRTDPRYVDEVELDAADWRRVLRELVQPRFLSAPVVPVAPVVHQLLQVRQIGAVLPRRRIRCFIWPAHPTQALSQIGQYVVGDIRAPGRPPLYIQRGRAPTTPPGPPRTGRHSHHSTPGNKLSFSLHPTWAGRARRRPPAGPPPLPPGWAVVACSCPPRLPPDSKARPLKSHPPPSHPRRPPRQKAQTKAPTQKPPPSTEPSPQPLPRPRPAPAPPVGRPAGRITPLFRRVPNRAPGRPRGAPPANPPTTPAPGSAGGAQPIFNLRPPIFSSSLPFYPWRGPPPTAREPAPQAGGAGDKREGGVFGGGGWW